MPSKRISWTDELIETKLKEIISEMKLDHFPTHSEIISFYGDKSLTCKISRRGGTVYWAEKLGVPLKQSETTFGDKLENRAITDIYENTGLVSILMSERHPYDILVDNCVKIDVKASKGFVNNCNSYAHTFRIEKKFSTCDLYILYCLDSNEQVLKTFIIPACVVIGQTQIGVGKVSKYDIYQNQWEYITEFCDFYRNYKKHV